MKYKENPNNPVSGSIQLYLDLIKNAVAAIEKDLNTKTEDIDE